MKRLFAIFALAAAISLFGPAIIQAAHSFDAPAAGNGFALDLYKQIAAAGDAGSNIFFSPYSIYTALAMTYAGARGATAAEMAGVLHCAGAGEELHRALQTLAGDIGSANGPGCRLDVANALWGQKDYGFLQSYLDLIARYYAGGFRQVDFIEETEKTRQEINAWVLQNTGGKIKDLIGRNDINASTRLVLTNAIYFKGGWAERFDRDLTQARPFHAETGKDTDVQMMSGSGEFLYAEPDRDLQILELPYEGGDLSMVILLPRDGLGDLEGSLDAKTLDDWLSGLRKRDVEVFLPRFGFQSRYYLQDILQSMGMREAFGGGADFSGMTGNRDLSISKVIHQADIEVDEEGTEAAAATAVVMGKSMPMVFKADRPFLFLIRQRSTGAILFMGRVSDPQA